MKATYTLKIDPKLRDQVREFCEFRGIKQGFFVEQALREHIEREEFLEDRKDLKRLKSEEALAMDLSSYLARRRTS